MLSQLSKGYGSWTAGYVDPYFGQKKPHEHDYTLPEIDQEAHVHGITVGSRSGRSTAMSWATTKRSREPSFDNIPLPKTYTTRKGALQLYVGPEDLEDDDEDVEELDNGDQYALKPKYVEIKRPHGQELINLSLKLGTIERLAMSVLQFGDEEYDHEHTSVSDAKNKAFLKFLHDVDKGVKTTGIDSSVQPGGDLNTYLRDLKSSASNHSGNMRISKSRESMELQAILRGLDNNSNWPMSYSQDGASDRQSVGQFTRPVSRVSSRGASPGPPSTPRSSYQVLSAKKVCASIRSGSYLGRPSSRVSVNDEELSEGDAGAPLTSASVTQPLWTPNDSTDDFLIESRNSFYRGDEENDSESGKRRGLKERSFLTNNSQLYKGRIVRKGEGQRAGEVKVISKGDGDSLVQIEEEFIGDSEHKNVTQNYSRSTSSRNSTLSGAGKESENTWAQRRSCTTEYSSPEVGPTDQSFDTGTAGIIEVAIDEKSGEKEPVEVVVERPSSRPSSHRSSGSNVSSRPSSHRTSNNEYSSYSGSTSTHTPSIITLQSVNTPISQEKFRSLYKRRNTYAYNPVKGIVKTNANQRRNSESNEDKNADLERLANYLAQNAQSIRGAKRYSGSNNLHPGWVGNNNGYDWSVNANNDADWPEDAEQNEAHANEPETGRLDTVEESSRQDDYEIADIDHEEYVIDRIEECNAEVKQIEEQAEGNNAIVNENDGGVSDTDSEMDEAMIKVILTGQSDKESKVSDEAKLGEADDVEKTDDGDIEINDEAERDEDAITSKGDIDDEVAEEANENVGLLEKDSPSDELQVTGIGQGILSTDEIQNVKAESESGSVDEENASDIRSVRSRKSRSKKSRSGVGSEEDEDSASANEFVIPSLESDRLLEEKDGSNKEDHNTVNDDHTGFSGSTDSYSDILASDKNSRPATASQSRPASSVRLSRPTSASARSVIDTENKIIEDSSPADNLQDTATAEETKEDIENVNGVPDVAEERLDKKERSNNVAVKDVVESKKENDVLKPLSKPDRKESLQKAPIRKESVSVPKAPIKKESSSIEPLVNTKKDTVPPVKDHLPSTDLKTIAKPQIENKKAQPVPKAGKEASDRKTVGKRATDKTGIPPKLPKPTDKVQERKPSLKGVAVDKGSAQKHTVKAALDKTVVEGEGLLDIVSKQTSKLDELSGDGVDGGKVTYTEDDSGKDAHAIAAELDALGLRKKPSKGSLYPLLPPGKRPKPPPEKAKIPDHIADALNRQTDASREYLEQDLERRGFLKNGKVTALVGETLSGPTLEAVGEGLTEEELELAKQILQQKLDDAKGKLDGKQSVPKPKGGKKPVAGKPAKKGGKKGKGKDAVVEKTAEELDREAMREKHEQEKKLREQEAAELQKKIAEKQQLLKEQNDLTSARSKELKEEMERLEREAEAIQRAEDEAREILADVRKKQREEREARRKADLERKKQEALERREREKKEMEDKRRKEMEMMEKIADAEMRRRMREEEERRIDEEERLAQERYEEELREAQRLEEEEEERLKEMERQAEEEAMQRLIEEREAAERERRRLREEEEALQEAENIKRIAMENERLKLEEERRKMQEAEETKREAERQRLMELRRLEEEVRIKMQEEIEKRRADALARRDCNLENRQHVDKLRHYQGITRAWTFSYFVHWPRETYERPIGEGDPRKVVKIKNPKPKQKIDSPPEGTEVPPAVP